MPTLSINVEWAINSQQELEVQIVKGNKVLGTMPIGRKAILLALTEDMDEGYSDADEQETYLENLREWRAFARKLMSTGEEIISQLEDYLGE